MYHNDFSGYVSIHCDKVLQCERKKKLIDYGGTFDFKIGKLNTSCKIVLSGIIFKYYLIIEGKDASEYAKQVKTNILWEVENSVARTVHTVIMDKATFQIKMDGREISSGKEFTRLNGGMYSWDVDDLRISITVQPVSREVDQLMTIMEVNGNIVRKAIIHNIQSR
jgi:hypothetical protein